MRIIEEAFRTWDGAELFYRAWLPPGEVGRAVLLFHRGHEHSGRWHETVTRLGLEDAAVFAWDQRGHGKSPGVRGDAANVAMLAKDADCFARHVSQKFAIPIKDMAIVATSVGAVIAAAWVHDFAPPVRGMVLAAPALRVKLYVPLAVPGLRAIHKVRPRGTVSSYVKSRMLTHDTQEAAAYDADPLIFKQISINLLLDLHDTGRRLIADAGAIRVPTLLLAAGRDWVVDLAAQRKFFARLGSEVKEMELFGDMYHALFQEQGRDKVIARTAAFLNQCFACTQNGDAILHADRTGYTRSEYERLRGRESLRWPIVRANMKSFGRLSNGIRLGWRAGFDSGVMLDYIYENRSRGITPLGKVIDHFYLNAIGWRGIRVRRENLERMLRGAIEQTHREGKPVRILDVAAGAGRYVLETMQRMNHIPISAVLRDYQQANLEAARGLAGKLGLQNLVIAKGDAFDRESLAAVIPRATIAIASGLYELFPENDPVMTSLHGIADALEEGGYLIYTCQPWHPQVEFIARALRNREGKPWIMRRRTQEEMDALVRAAGFEKINQEIDPWGIFTVSLARRVRR